MVWILSLCRQSCRSPRLPCRLTLRALRFLAWWLALCLSSLTRLLGILARLLGVSPAQLGLGAGCVCWRWICR